MVALRFQARHLKRKELGDREYYFTSLLPKSCPLPYGSLEVTYFLRRFRWFWDVFYWEDLATHWYLSSVCSL